MAARALHPQNRKGRNLNPSPATRFKPGQSGNPGGLSAAARKAADAARDLALAHGQELLPDGRSRARAALDKLFELGCNESNTPALTAYLDRVGYKPTERVTVDGDLRLFLRPRVHQQEPDADRNG